MVKEVSGVVIESSEDRKTKSTNYQPREAIIFGVNPLSIGLFGLELSRGGYGVSFVDCGRESHSHGEREYNVYIDSQRHAFSIDEMISLRDEDRLAKKTESAGLMIVTNPLREYSKVGRAIGNALHDGYCQIDRHDRNFLNILACNESHRPANALRNEVHEAWKDLGARVLISLGVSGMRITNAIAKRGCKEKNGMFYATLEWAWSIEKDMWTEYLPKKGSLGEIKVIDSHKELDKAKKKGNASVESQFLGEVPLNQIKLLDNLTYDSHFRSK